MFWQALSPPPFLPPPLPNSVLTFIRVALMKKLNARLSLYHTTKTIRDIPLMDAAVLSTAQ